ncbi:hypothetical protein EK904_012451 [Melospiza melodia maxima]|nr:hypothetical protein EK904_012451 [Melospiza melodia maxima]
MLASPFLPWLVQGLVQWLQPAGEGLDEAVWERMGQRAEQEKARLRQELEHQSLEQGPGAWGALLAWHFWALVAILVLLPALCFGVQAFRHHPGNSGLKDSSGSNLEEEEDNVVAHIEHKDGNRDDYKDGNEGGSGVDVKEKGHGGNEAKQCSSDAKEYLNNEKKGVEVLLEMMKTNTMQLKQMRTTMLIITVEAFQQSTSSCLLWSWTKAAW